MKLREYNKKIETYDAFIFAKQQEIQSIKEKIQEIKEKRRGLDKIAQQEGFLTGLEEERFSKHDIEPMLRYCRVFKLAYKPADLLEYECYTIVQKIYTNSEEQGRYVSIDDKDFLHLKIKESIFSSPPPEVSMISREEFDSFGDFNVGIVKKKCYIYPINKERKAEISLYERPKDKNSVELVKLRYNTIEEYESKESLPDWIGRDVSGSWGYSEGNLASKE